MKADRFWISLILLWSAAQIAWRFVQGPALELDEAEALYHAHHLALGYNAQPPLYFWLQWAVFQVFGEGVFALALLKNALLGTGFLALYAMLRRLRPPMEAGLGVLTLGLLPQILWEAQRALTHSVLVVTLALVTLAVADRVLHAKGRWSGIPGWAAFGAAVGLGVISKWNFALLPAAILVAALWLPELRKRLWWPGAAVAIVVAVAIILPPLSWVIENPQVAGGSLHKLGFSEGGPVVRAASGLGSLLSAYLAFWGLLILVAVGVRVATRGASSFKPDSQSRLIAMVTLFGAALLGLGILVSGATEVKDRWLLPVAIFAAPLVGYWLMHRLAPRGQRRLFGGLFALWAVAFLLLPISGRVDPGWRSADYRMISEHVSQLAPETAQIVSDDTWVAGNLRHWLPQHDIRRLTDVDFSKRPILWISREGVAADMPRSAGLEVEPLDGLETPRGTHSLTLDLALTR